MGLWSYPRAASGFPVESCMTNLRLGMLEASILMIHEVAHMRCHGNGMVYVTCAHMAWLAVCVMQLVACASVMLAALRECVLLWYKARKMDGIMAGRGWMDFSLFPMPCTCTFSRSDNLRHLLVRHHFESYQDLHFTKSCPSAILPYISQRIKGASAGR